VCVCVHGCMRMRACDFRMVEGIDGMREVSDGWGTPSTSRILHRPDRGGRWRCGPHRQSAVSAQAASRDPGITRLLFSTPLLLHYPTHFSHRSLVLILFPFFPSKMNLMLIFELFAFYGSIHRTDSFYIFIRNIPPHMVLARKMTCKHNHAMYIYFFLKSFAIQL